MKTEDADGRELAAVGKDSEGAEEAEGGGEIEEELEEEEEDDERENRGGPAPLPLAGTAFALDLRRGRVVRVSGELSPD